MFGMYHAYFTLESPKHVHTVECVSSEHHEYLQLKPLQPIDG